MNKFLESLGVIALVCLSFVYTEKTVDVVKEYDEIMVEIKKQNNNYKVDAKDVLIDGDTIIPGLKGKQINENKSYSKMKRYGKFNSSLFVYEDLLPKKSIDDYLNKYIISGNPNKNMISIIFLVNENDDITDILSTLKEKNIKANFFIDSKWLEKNENLLFDIIKLGHNVGNLNIDNQNGNYSWTDTIVKKVGKQKNGYCYAAKKDSNILKYCSLLKNHTIIPNIIVDNYPLKEIKDKIKSGSIIALKINETTKKELGTVISYISSKGYKIVNLNEHLSE